MRTLFKDEFHGTIEPIVQTLESSIEKIKSVEERVSFFQQDYFRQMQIIYERLERLERPAQFGTVNREMPLTSGAAGTATTNTTQITQQDELCEIQVTQPAQVTFSVGERLQEFQQELQEIKRTLQQQLCTHAFTENGARNEEEKYP